MAFVVDASLSMRTNVMTAPGPDGKSLALNVRCVDWAFAELRKAILGLSEPGEFTVLAFNDNCRAWSRTLRAANKEGLDGALMFIDSLVLEHGSDLRTVVEPLSRLERLDSVCIISDGGIDRTGEVEQLFLAWNYLLGARLITYGFVPPVEGQQGILENLGRSHHGWYNVVRGATPAPR
jgi:hypothetical protein